MTKLRLVALCKKTNEQKRTRIINDLKKLFNSQIATLKDRGVPEQIVEIFIIKKNKSFSRALGIWEEKYPEKTLEQLANRGIHLALPVTPLSWRGPHDQMAVVRNGGKTGYTCLNPIAISDVVETPKELYYIYDVEDGSSTRGESPKNAQISFMQQKRSPLTAAEAMALPVHTNVLSKHYVWAAGSRYEFADCVPLVYLGGGVRPRLGHYHVDNAFDCWGSASCGSR